nr:hypothetical protein [uncultured Desulfobacter sp.]
MSFRLLQLRPLLLEKETGLQYFETVLRYLFSTMDDISAETIKGIAEKALSKKEGEYIMTLAEKLRQEGKIEGKQEGLRDAIELGMTLKFPDHMNEVMEQVTNLNDLEALKKIKEAIKTATDVSQIRLLINEIQGRFTNFSA